MQSNNALTRRVLDGFKGPERSLLDFLATDSVYSFKDDFDKGFDTNFWGTFSTRGAGFEGDSRFEDVDEPHGWIVGNLDGGDDDAVWLWSPRFLSPRKRPAVMARFRLGNMSDVKIEFGFGVPMVDPKDSTVQGFVNVKATPTSRTPFAGNYAVICYDSDHNTSIDIVGQTQGTTTRGARSGGPTVGTEFTLMLAMSEHGGVQSWVDGQRAATLELQPFASTAAFGAMADRQTAAQGKTIQDIRHGTEERIGLWVFCQNRAANSNHSMSIDYVQAWEERLVP